MPLFYRYIGNKKVCVIGLGCWGIGGKIIPDKSLNKYHQRIIEYYLKLGGNLIDTAETYSIGNADKIIGKVLSSFDRDSIFILYKIWPTNYERVKMKRAVDAALRRLNTDYIDGLLLHIPVESFHRIREAIETMIEIKNEGITNFIGLSNFNFNLFYKLKKLYSELSIIELEYNLVNRSIEKSNFLSFLQRNNIYIFIYSIFMEGNIFNHYCYKCLKDKYDIDFDKLAINYAVRQKNVFSIIGMHTYKHIKRNLEIVDKKIWKKIEPMVRECCGSKAFS